MLVAMPVLYCVQTILNKRSYKKWTLRYMCVAITAERLKL